MAPDDGSPYDYAMQTRRIVVVGLLAAALVGCHKAKPKEIDLARAFPNLPLPPEPQILTADRGTEAMQIIVVSPVTADSAVAYYRTVLSTDPFRLINEQKSGKMTTFYAEQDGPSLWVSVAPNGTAGSQITLAGGDSIPKETPRTATKTP